jgi:hypothetical protein
MEVWAYPVRTNMALRESLVQRKPQPRVYKGKRCPMFMSSLPFIYIIYVTYRFRDIGLELYVYIPFLLSHYTFTFLTFTPLPLCFLPLRYL